jgi:cyclopropane fatty-acyl-phospholipid synthase-like methyltransferase
MAIELAPPYENLTFMTALSEERADQLVAFLASSFRGTVVDLGCGWAELLLRVAAAAPECTAMGIDNDADAIAFGARLAEQRGLADRVRLVVGDASAPLDGVDAAICIGASQIWGDPDAPPRPINYGGALSAIRALVPRGGRVVYGEGIWSAPPTEAAVAPLGGLLDEFVPLAELVELAVDAGFMPIAVHEANLDEWDVFESGYTACYARWLAEHDADHPDAAEVRARAQRQRNAYLRGYRGILGLAYLQLLAV